MDQKIIISDVQYHDPEHEAILNEIEGRLTTKVELQGTQDGVHDRPKTSDEHQALILNLIEVAIQNGIDLNQKRYLPISGGAAARLIETEAEKKERELQNEIYDEEHTLPGLLNEAKKIQPDVKMMRIRKWVFVGLIFIALSEGIMSHSPLRHANFPVLAAIIACIAIAFAVGISSHYLGGWIKDAKNRVQEVTRYAISMIPAIIGFSELASLRASAYNHTSNLQVGSRYVTSHSQSSASALAIAVVSILLYWVALFLSSHFFRTKEARLQEHAYEEKCKAVEDLQQAIKDKKDEIVKVRDEKISQMTLAVKRFEYALYQELQLINFAQEAAEAYKQKNLRHRSDGCPNFFSQKPVFHFTRFFNNAKQQTQKYEAVN